MVLVCNIHFGEVLDSLKESSRCQKDYHEFFNSIFFPQKIRSWQYIKINNINVFLSEVQHLDVCLFFLHCDVYIKSQGK